MRFSHEVEKYRIRTGPYASHPLDDFGAFIIPGPKAAELRVLVSQGFGEYNWEHVSVSLKNRCPNWPEMCFVKDLFWSEEETVIQLHPPKSMWINNHPYCLHMWRPTKETVPLPPSTLVGDRELGNLFEERKGNERLEADHDNRGTSAKT